MTSTASGGRGSFAAAIDKANEKEGSDRIRFGGNLRGKIDLPTKPITIGDSVTIQGNGYGSPESKRFGRLVLSGASGGSVLQVNDERNKAAFRDLFLERVSISARSADVSVVDSFLDGQRTVEASGIYAGGGRLRVSNTTVRRFAVGVVFGVSGRIDRSTVARNVGRGGIQVGPAAHAYISNSTISGNVYARGHDVYGGGIQYEGYDPVRVVNSTITGNKAVATPTTTGEMQIEAESAGGGIYGPVELVNSTVSGNRADTGAGVSGVGASYGGAGATNSIVFGNTDFDGTPSDCEPPFRSGGGNVIGEPGSCVPRPNDISADPLLGPLADNGGPTETMAIGIGSPAVGRALRKNSPKFDQRGVRRGNDPDTGAFERRGD